MASSLALLLLFWQWRPLGGTVWGAFKIYIAGAWDAMIVLFRGYAWVGTSSWTRLVSGFKTCWCQPAKPAQSAGRLNLRAVFVYAHGFVWST